MATDRPSAEDARRINEVVGRYAVGDAGSLVNLLHDLQQELGHLPEEALRQAAKQLGLPRAQVYGVASFYQGFHLTPRGKHTVRVCLGTACYVRGAKKVMQAIQEQLGIKKGDLVELESVRGKVRGVAVVTTRLKPLQVSDNGSKKTIHVVGITWHFGYIGFVPGGPERNGISDRSYAANQITPHVGDANTTIPEYKAFLVNLRKVK